MSLQLWSQSDRAASKQQSVDPTKIEMRAPGLNMELLHKGSERLFAHVNLEMIAGWRPTGPTDRFTVNHLAASRT
jgi:hypothetical protein